MKKFLSFFVALVLVVSLFSGCAKKLSGVYETESSTGSFVRYTFSDGEVVCTSYMLNVKVSEERGSYAVEKNKITFTYEDGESETFPFEDNGDYLLINETEYYKQ